MDSMCANGGTRATHHDLRNRYFRRDTIVLLHLDVFRCVSLIRGRWFEVLKTFLIR